MAGILKKSKSSVGSRVGSRYKKQKFNRQNYSFHKLGEWNRFTKNRTFIVSVVYDLPGPNKKREPVDCVFDSSHWSRRIDMLRFAVPYLAEIYPTAICLPADFIGFPGWDNSSIPDKKLPENSVINKIKSSKTYKDLLRAWQSTSMSLIFGYGFVDEEGDPVENQLVCVTDNSNNLLIVRKNSNTNYDWPRLTKIQNKKFSIAVCFDQESVNWKKACKNSILVNPRHISSIGIQKENESKLKAAKRTGSAHSGRLTAGMNRRIKDYGFSHIFCPVFRFKSKTPIKWDPTSNGFTWSAKKAVSPHTHYKPKASLLVENSVERAYFNIFEV